MRAATLATAFIALSIFSSACATTLDTGSFVSRDTNFQQYRSYNWAPQSRTDSDPRFSGNAVFKDHFEGEVEKQLAAKGIAGPQARRPDLLVRYRAAVTPRTTVTGVESGYGSCTFDCADYTAQYEQATLIIDVVDARTRKVVWRGWARDDIDDILHDQDRMESRIRQAVAEMMAKLPAHVPAGA